jgi:hypothetical protein
MGRRAAPPTEEIVVAGWRFSHRALPLLTSESRLPWQENLCIQILMMIPRDSITRRELLQRLALLTGATLVPWRVFGATEPAPSDQLGPLLPLRTLG